MGKVVGSIPAYSTLYLEEDSMNLERVNYYLAGAVLLLLTVLAFGQATAINGLMAFLFFFGSGWLNQRLRCLESPEYFIRKGNEDLVPWVFFAVVALFAFFSLTLTTAQIERMLFIKYPVASHISLISTYICTWLGGNAVGFLLWWRGRR